MENVGIFYANLIYIAYANLVYFMPIWYNLWSFVNFVTI
jgi:hypothetical protein